MDNNQTNNNGLNPNPMPQQQSGNDEEEYDWADLLRILFVPAALFAPVWIPAFIGSVPTKLTCSLGDIAMFLMVVLPFMPFAVLPDRWRTAYLVVLIIAVPFLFAGAFVNGWVAAARCR